MALVLSKLYQALRLAGGVVSTLILNRNFHNLKPAGSQYYDTSIVTLPGNAQDHENVLSITLPPQSVIASADNIVYISDQITIEQAVMTIGYELSKPENTIIIANREIFMAAHNTPYWQLWCTPYIFSTDEDETYKHYLSLLSIPSTTTRAEARDIIRQIIRG